MRFACLCLLPAALLATGCGVPDVHFADAGTTRDSPAVDAPEEEVAMDAQPDAPGDAPEEGTDSGDAGTDAPEYCKGDAGPPTGSMYKCDSGQNGTVCSGNCTAQQCLACVGAPCTWPAVCCPAMGNMAHCSLDGGC